MYIYKYTYIYVYMYIYVYIYSLCEAVLMSLAEGFMGGLDLARLFQSIAVENKNRRTLRTVMMMNNGKRERSIPNSSVKPE
jgi:hypothetical protein